MPRHQPLSPLEAAEKASEGFVLRGGDSGKSLRSVKSREKLGNFSAGFLSVPQAAKALSVDAKTIKRWCETGKIPAMAKPYGKTITYLISSSALDMLLVQKQSLKLEAREKKRESLPHSEYLQNWSQAMAKGLINGRAFSPHTIASYNHYAGEFFRKHQALSIDTLKTSLAELPLESVAVREKTFKALVCFAKFLVMESALDKDFLEQVKPLAPKYHKPPKRYTVNYDELEKLFDACESTLEKVALQLIAQTGLRASEFCALTTQDIDLAEGVLLVRCGKGGKQRRIGLTKLATEQLALYLSTHSELSHEAPLFYNGKGQPLKRDNLYQLLHRLGKRAGVPVHPHALRRAFVTLNANKGRPLQMLQMACGHAKITTTMSYCRTSEQEVIQAMKGWE